MKVLNFDPKCLGKWTRVQENLGVTQSSVIDYVITDEKFAKHLTDMIIDEEKAFAPFWLKNKKDGKKRQHSDHNSIYLNFNLPYCPNDFNEDSLHAQGGWKITPTGMEQFSHMTENMEEIEDHNLVDFSKHLDTILDSCFPRKSLTKRNSHPNVNKEHLITAKPLLPILKLIIGYLKRGKCERVAARVYITFIQNIQSQNVHQRKAEKISQVINNVSNDQGGLSVDKFWKLKKSLSCTDTSRFSVVTPNDIELFSGPAIIKEYQKEFSNRLAHRKIDDSFKSYEEATNKLFNMYLSISSKSRSEPDFTTTEVYQAMRSLKEDSSAGPNRRPPSLYINAGRGLVVNITKLFNHIKRNTVFPQDWFDLIIVTIYKNKGSRKKLEFYRGIFLANIITKIFEKVIKKRISPQLQKVNLLQAGSRTGRSTCDDIFLINGLIDHAKYLNARLYLTFYDYSTCFDSLWLEDSMISLWELGIQNELFALIFKMNEVARIKVKTPFGMSAPFVCKDIVKQGTVLSSNICSASTGEICNYNTKGGASVGTLTISDVLYVDDTTDPNTDIVDTIMSHDEIVNFSLSKRLSLNQPKCCIITINKKSTDSVPTLIICRRQVQHVSKSKFLGDIVNEKGTNSDLIGDRVSKGNAAIINCITMCNEVTLGIFFTKTAMTLYHSVFLSVILFNSAVWTNITDKDMKNLRTIQLKYLKRVARAPYSTPNAFVFLEFGVLPVEYLIHIRQLTFLHHVVHLNQDDPVFVMFEQQQQLPFEQNWSSHIFKLLKSYDLRFSDVKTVSKEKWKSTVKDAVRTVALYHLTQQSASKSKTKHLQYSELLLQPYLLHYNHKEASTIFKIRSRSTECKQNRKNSVHDMSCRLCTKGEETQDHVVNCNALAQNGKIVDLNRIMGEVPLNCDETREICSRFNEFSKFINNPP